MFSHFFQKSYLYEIMWKNIIERGRPQMTIRQKRLACWIPRATNKLSISLFLPGRAKYLSAPMYCCFYTVIIVTRKRLNVTLQCTVCLVLGIENRTCATTFCSSQIRSIHLHPYSEHTFPRIYEIHQEQQSPINIRSAYSTKPARIRPSVQYNALAKTPK